MPFVYFAVMVGVLVFVHELGHFVWAKYFGVRVIKFSLGFGPKIAGFRRGETEYVVSLLPIGGYVRMLGESPLDEVPPEEAARAFPNQHVLKRIVIVTAGPAMNLIFPLVLYFVVFLGDTQMTPASVGVVFPDRPADGKLLPGDRVVEVDYEEVSTFYELSRAIENRIGEPLAFKVQRGDQVLKTTITPERATKQRPLDRSEELGRIGVMPRHPLAVIGVTSPASPAASARLRTFDVIAAVAGRRVDRWIDLEKLLGDNQGGLVPVTYLRPTTIRDALGGLADLDLYEPRVATLTPEPGAGSGVARAGLELADLYVSDVVAGSPEHRAGLLPGDRLLTLDGRPIRLWATFLEDLRAGHGREHTLSFRRGDRELTAKLSLAHERGETEHGQVYDRYVVGIRNYVSTGAEPSVANPHPIVYALRESVRATAEVVELTVFSVVRLVQGRLTVKSIGGPLTIFEVAGTAAREGALNYLTLMAFISINLGLINLLPVPLLDGGHLMFFFLEAVARRPLSMRAREYAYIAGLAVLVFIMTLAFKNDIERQWPSIMNEIAGE